MKEEDRSKLLEFINDLDGLKSRDPEEKKFKDWKEKTEKKLEDAFGSGSDPVSRLRRVRFHDFSRSGRHSGAPLTENERREYIQGLEEAKRLLRRFV